MLHFVHMKRTSPISLLAAGLIALAAFASPARALQNVTYEMDYNWQVMQSSFTGVTSKTVDIAGFGGAGYAVNGSTPNVIGFSYAMLPVGSSATFTISQTTKTYSSLALNAKTFNNPSATDLYSASLAPAISTSPAITIPAGTTMRDAYYGHFQAQTINPVFTFSGLAVASTYYLIVEYGLQRR